MKTITKLLACIVLAMPATVAGAPPGCAALLEEAGATSDLRNTDPAKGIEQARSGIERARDAGCPAARVEMHAALGDNLNVTGQRDQALQSYRRALELLEQAPDPALHASVLRRSAVTLAQQGKLAQSLEWLLESLSISESIDDEPSAAMTASNIGSVLSQMKQFGRSREYFERAHAVHEAQGNEFGLASVSINLGTLLMRMADRAERDDEVSRARELREQALAYNQAALEQFESLDNPRGIAASASNAGAVVLQLGRPSEALSLLQRALELAQELGQPLNELSSRLHLANALVELDRAEEAVPHMERAWDIVGTSTLTNRAGIAEAWVRLEESRGNLAEALEWQHELGRIRNRIMEADLEARVAEIEARYDSERQQRRISALQHEQEVSTLQLERERQVRYAAFAIVVLLLALSASLYARYQLKVSSQHALELAARSDPLTGLANRRHMRERIEYEIQRTRRSGNPFSLALLDVDDFKAINDAHGHATGDEVLMGVANRINSLLRRQDTLARWGGDELLLLLPETGEDGAARLGKKLIDLFAHEPVRVGDRAFDVSMTIGISQYWPGMDLGGCIKQADAAMYTGKRAGKQRVARGTKP